MADISLSFSAEGGISLDDLVGIFTGTNDPSIAGETAPVGSLFIQQNGQLYQKIGTSDTNWIKFSQGLGDVVRIDLGDNTSGYLNDKLVVTPTSLTKTIGNLGGDEYLNLDLTNVGTAGSYTKVTTDAKGRVVGGLNPTTLSGYGIVDAQPLDSTLSALAGFNSNGVVVQTAPNTFAARTLTGTLNEISILNGDGVAGNPVISLPSSMLTLPGTEGFIPPIGTTAQRVNAVAYTRFNSTTSRLEYFDGTTWISIDPSTGGTVTSITVDAPSAGILVNGSPITTAGVITLELANDLAAVEGLATFGLAARVATDSWVTRELIGALNRIVITDGDAVANNPTIDIDSAYAGQTSINTLGTITTGTWQGTPIATQFGGTGRRTIGGANSILGVATTGTELEYKSIIGGTGIGITLSPQQILITNTGVQSLIGTTDQVIVSPIGGTGVITLSLPQSIDVENSPSFAQITLASDPTQPFQVATKHYVDNVIQGLEVKQAVRAATTGNIVLSGLQIVDGISLVAGDRVLVKDQTTASQNGIYVVDTGVWARAVDVSTWAELPAAFTFVQEGSTLQDTGWISTAISGGTLETSAVPWVQFSSAGIIQAGTGLTKTGNVVSIANTAVAAGSGYNNFVVNAQGQITAATTIPYLTANQTIVLGGDASGSGTNAITVILANTGVAAGTYTQVTVDSKGRVTAATNPNTLSGYGIVDAQPLSTYLTSVNAVATNGLVVKNGSTAYARSIVAGSSKVSVINGDGTLGNPSIDIVESSISIDNLSGTLTVAKGGTNLTTLGSANQILAVNSATTGLEYISLTGTGITVTVSDTSINFATVNNGTVTSIDVLGSTGIASTGGPVTSSGTIQLTLGAELQGLSGLSATGLTVRTGTATYASRSIVSGANTISITNPQGIAGNIGLDLATVGTPGNYYKVTTDIFGRVVSGAALVPWSAINLTPTTLAGYGITDAQPLNSILTTIVNSPLSGIVVKNGTTSAIRSIVATTPKIVITNGDGIAGNPSVDLGAVNLGDLANVTVPSPTNGDSLVFDGTNWINGSVTPKLYAEHAIGYSTPVAVGQNSVALGSAATANAHDSLAIGVQSLARLPGITQANGRFATQGDAQAGKYLVRTGTINAFPAEMFLDGPNGSERLVLASDMTWVWEATIIGHQTDGTGNHAGFKLKGVIYSGASLNSITMLGTPTKEILARSDQSWDVSVSADTTQGSLKLTVKGAAGQTIRWMAVVATTEITN